MTSSPDTYTHGHHASVLKSHTWRTVENSAQYLQGDLVPGRSVLDVGCGPGTLTADIAKLVAPGTVIGLDYSAQIVEAAAARLVADEVEGPVDLSFTHGDIYGLDYPDNHFDIVHAHQVLQHLSDPVAALREMGRVVADDGVVAVRDADYQAMTWYPALPELDDWMTLYQAVARRNDAEPNAARHLVAWARQAGFDMSVASASASAWCFADEPERAWWGGLWSERIISSSLADQAIAYGLATESELKRLSQGWLRWAEHSDAWFAVLNGELLLR